MQCPQMSVLINDHIIWILIWFGPHQLDVQKQLIKIIIMINIYTFMECINATQVDSMSAQLEVLFSDAQETLEQIELESHTLEPGGREKVKTRVTSYQAELKRQQEQVASSKTEAGERSDRLELLSRPGHHHHGGGGGEEFQGGENSLLLAETEEILSEAGRQLHDGRRLLEETQEVKLQSWCDNYDHNLSS